MTFLGVVVVVEHIETAEARSRAISICLTIFTGSKVYFQQDNPIPGYMGTLWRQFCCRALRLEGGLPIGIVHRVLEIQPAIAAPELPVLCHTITVAHPIPKESR